MASSAVALFSTSPSSPSSRGGASDYSSDAASKAKVKELNNMFLNVIVDQYTNGPKYADMTNIMAEYQNFAERLDSGRFDLEETFQFTPCAPGLPGLTDEVVEEVSKEDLSKDEAAAMAFGLGVSTGDVSLSGKAIIGTAVSQPVEGRVKATKRRRCDTDVNDETKVDAVTEAVKKHSLKSPQ